MNVKKAIAVIMTVVLLAGCSSGQDPRSQLNSAPDIGITQAVWNAYTNGYLVYPSPVAFAVSENGKTYYYFYCTSGHCLNPNSNEAVALAISRCQDRGQGSCVLFASGRSPPRKHHFIDDFSQRLKSP